MTYCKNPIYLYLRACDQQVVCYGEKWSKRCPFKGDLGRGHKDALEHMALHVKDFEMNGEHEKADNLRMQIYMRELSNKWFSRFVRKTIIKLDDELGLWDLECEASA